MKQFWTSMVLATLFLAHPGAQEGTVVDTEKEKVSYGIGVDVARNFKRLALDIDADALVKGLRDTFSGATLAMTEEELRVTMDTYRTDLMRRQIEATKRTAEVNKKAGEAFLTVNKAKDGVVALASGLQYQVVKAGDGKNPGANDTVVCRYRGTLIDGTEFDSSERVGQPAVFNVSGVIPGWKEALQIMPVGSTWRLIVPSELAYGARGAGRDIGPNATLVFDLELLEIK